ncbi:MAG: sulfatase-like hydrolase/transferase [Alphaproteobacteria bacterium]
MKTPNVLFICADEHTRGALPCYGSPFIKAPNLERLAGRGTRFAAAYTTSPLCVPGRASMISGRYVHEIGAWDNGHPYRGVPSGWAHRLRERGYHTVSIGKNHYRSIEDDNGFAEELLPMHVRWGIGDLYGMLREEAPYPNPKSEGGSVVFGPAMMAEIAGPGETNHTAYDRRIAKVARNWLRQEASRRGSDPWALYVSFVAPHFPLVAPREFYELYPHDRIPWPTHYEATERSRHPVIQALMRVWNYDDFFDTAKVLRARAGYYGLISFLDHNIGRILTTLEGIGQLDDTCILYTSDHGEMLGNKGIWSTSALYEDSAGVPMIMAGPGVPSGRTAATPVSHVDLFPTLADIGRAAEDGDRGMPGRSLLQSAAADEPERVVFSEYHAGGSITGCYMLRRGRWKYMYYVGYAPELYDLAADPTEGKDFGQDPAYAEIRKACEAELRKIVDPEAANARALADQAATIERHGGVDAVRRRGHPGEHSLDRRLGIE